MSTKSREVIWGGRIMGADIRAKSAREAAQKALLRLTAQEAEAWSIRMEGYGGPAQPSPTIAQCLRGGLGWLEVDAIAARPKQQSASVMGGPPTSRPQQEAGGPRPSI